jgi:hypothetical protein
MDLLLRPTVLTGEKLKDDYCVFHEGRILTKLSCLERASSCLKLHSAKTGHARTSEVGQGYMDEKPSQFDKADSAVARLIDVFMTRTELMFGNWSLLMQRTSSSVCDGRLPGFPMC